MKSRNIQEILPIQHGMDPLEIMIKVDGYYECPKNPQTGKREGPMVDYAGKSERNNRQLVGDVYLNFAMAEEYPHVVNQFVQELLPKLAPFMDGIDAFCGLPMGGLALGYHLALTTNRRYIFPEKVVTIAKTKTTREESELVFSRHQPRFRERLALVEDVANNFSTIDKTIELVEKAGAVVAPEICFLNRSPFVEETYRRKDDKGDLTILARIRKAIPEYDDDDPEVKGDIARGNIIRKPKNNWAPLRELMQKK